MTHANPDFHDADVVLRLYDLRREAVMRESRRKINATFHPKSYEEFLEVTKMDNPLNEAFRQTSTYWEMVYGFAKWGIVNPDFLVENNGEGLFLYAKVEPYLEKFRAENMTPTAFQNAEWIARNSATAGRRLETIRARLAKMAAAK